MSLLSIRMSKISIDVKARYIKPFCYVYAVIGIFYTYLYSVVFKADVLAMCCLVASFAALALAFFRKRINSHYINANLIMLLYYVLMSSLVFYGGGIQAYSVWWLCTISILASFLLNAFFGIIWFVLVEITFFIILYMGNHHLLPPNALINAPTESRFIFSHFTNSTLILVLCVLAEMIRDKAFTEKEELRLKAFQLNQVASLGKLASGVAHEINNPLTVIKGFQHRIFRMIESEAIINKIELADYMYKIESSVHRIQTVTSLMRTISEQEHDRSISQFILNELLQDVVHMLQKDIEKSSIKINLKFLSEEIQFKGIYSEIFQAFFNLIENSIQELNEIEGPRIVEVILYKDDKNAIVLIEDNGRGILPEDRNHIFDPFFTSKSTGVGRGLGLRFSLNAFLSNSGSLDLLDDVNKTVFRATLPFVTN